MTLLDPPILGEDIKSGLPVLMIAMDIAGSSCVVVTSDSDGKMALQDITEVRSDWRYDFKSSKWYDASVGLPDG